MVQENEEITKQMISNGGKNMKKLISILISITILILCLSGCSSGFKQGNIVISDDANFVTSSTTGGFQAWYPTHSFQHLKSRITEESEEDKYFTYVDNLVCKGTVAGGSFQEHNYEWNLYSVVSNAILYTPIRVEEIYYQGDQMDVEVKVGDIIYVGQYMCVFTEELLEHYPNALEFFSAKNIGDIYMRDGRNYEYREMLFRKGDSYLLMLDGKEGRTFEHNGKEYFFSPALSPMLNIFNLSREPKTAEEQEIKSDLQINCYNAYLQIRKDAIDYYINGNKEVLK